MNESTHTPLLIIGAGPGGYAAAFHAADLGMAITLVDDGDNPGGVCLFRGCIPSKALLHAARVISETREAAEIGLDFGAPAVNLDKLRDWKSSVVTRLTGGLGQLSRQRKVSFIQGRAKFLDATRVVVSGKDGGTQEITFDQAIIATGSQPITLPFAPLSERVMDSTGALDLKDIPPRLLIIGGGYIGLELGSVYQALGSAVSVVEMTPGLLPGVDRDLVLPLAKRLKDQFKNIYLESKVTAVDDNGTEVSVTFGDKDGKDFTNRYDRVLVAVGRRPDAGGVDLAAAGVAVTERGFIQVDDQRRTSAANIWAIGDIAGNPMLAHKASHEGRVAAEAIAGQKTVFAPRAIPAVVFTDPEIAWCGLTDTEAKAAGREVKTLKFPWAASGRAVTLNRTEGMTKILTDPASGRVLGVGIVGVGAGEMIAAAVLAIEMGATAEDLALTIHPHPTLCETVMEAAEQFLGQATHIYRPKR